MGHGHSHHEHGKQSHRHAEGRDRFGNPEDLRAYMERMESPDRDGWQKPDEVVAALALKPGSVVAEIGAGIGYFSFRLARAVGPSGHVFAVEVEPAILRVFRDRLAASELRNVSPIWALGDDPLLPPGACDAILMVGAYHHFPDGPAMLKRLAQSLRPGGRIANVDFDAGELPVGPPPDHKLSREQFLKDAQQAGLHREQEWDFLPYHYFVALSRNGG